ncbi:MAG: Fic family protein [Cyclobacteriaceae bacterium]|nr:Fic family protein [Cyclobacteriaceae bacterium]
MAFHPSEPYNELPLLPPAEELEGKDILKATILAHRALARLEGSLSNLPNPAILLDSIGLQEAKVSSEIENIITTHDELYQYAVAERSVGNSATKEVLHYKEALWYGHEQVREKGVLTTNLFVKLVQVIKENQSGIRNTPGTQIVKDKTREVIYTPPVGEEIIRTKLKNLEEFLNLNDDGLDPLVKMAVAHYQFEAIHPFGDGNGRTGRIINILYLVQQGLLRMPVLYLSRYILEHRSDYYQLLREVTEEGNWQRWILYMIHAVEETSKLTLHKIEEIKVAMTAMSEAIKQELPNIYSKDLVEVLFQRPYSKRQFLVEAGIVKVKTAGTYLASLEEKGFLKSVELGKEKLYLNVALLDILKK